MKSRIFKNLFLKLLSLSFAIIIWVSITNELNPMTSASMMVEVNLKNEEELKKINKTYVLLGQRSCKVNYEILASQQKNVRQSDFNLYVDLANLTPETTSLPIQYSISSDIALYLSNVTIEPQNLQIKLDDVSRKQYEVKYNIVGNPGEGRSIGDVALAPNIVYVSGSDEEIAKINKIYVDININSMDEMIYGVEHIKIKDKNGEDINVDDIDLSNSEIGYTVSIFSRASVTFNSKVNGTVKRGYEFAGIQTEPTSIMIEGPKSMIENIYSIDLPEINIEDLAEDKEYTFAISDVLPSGIRCNGTSVVVAKVKVNDNILNKPTRDLENEGPINEINKNKEFDEEKNESGGNKSNAVIFDGVVYSEKDME